MANGEPDGRKKTTIALSRRSGSIRVRLELDRLALRQREQCDSRPLSRASHGQGMQNVDRPAEIQALPQPERARRPRVESEALRLVPRPEGLNRISGHRDRRRDVGQETAVRPPEPERAVGREVDLIALLVDRAVVPVTEERKVGQRGRAALRPVAEVMPLGEAPMAPREAAALIPMLEGAP